MQTAISKTRYFSCFQFNGDVVALTTALPKLDYFTIENTHRTEVWLRTVRKRPDGVDTVSQQLHKHDWIFIDHDETSGYRIIKEKDFDRLYRLDPDPRYEYKSAYKVWHNGADYVIATSAENATEALIADGYDYLDEMTWEELPAGKQLTVFDEVFGPCTQLCCAWAEQQKGFLCSSEF